MKKLYHVTLTRKSTYHAMSPKNFEKNECGLQNYK